MDKLTFRLKFGSTNNDKDKKLSIRLLFPSFVKKLFQKKEYLRACISHPILFETYYYPLQKLFKKGNNNFITN